MTSDGKLRLGSDSSPRSPRRLTFIADWPGPDLDARIQGLEAQLIERLHAVNHARSRNRIPLAQPSVVHVRRSYADCRLGQLHVTTAYPSGGGFDERTPLLCIHQAAGSGRWFNPILKEMG